MNNFKISKGEFTVKSEPKVIVRKDIEIVGIGLLPGYIEYDFTGIPEKYHEIFLMAIKGQM